MNDVVETERETPSQRRARERESQSAKRRELPPVLIVVIAIALVAAMIVFGRFCSSAATISVTVNGASVSLHGAKNMDTAIRESGLPINPGDLISLQGNVLKRSAGYPFYATVNGEETTDPDRTLNNGDVIEVTDGKDKLEDYDADAEVYPHSADIYGMGALCKIQPGQDGILEHRTGLISGEKADAVTQKTEDATATWYSPDVGNDKVVALTFDMGPSEKYTADILDILEENDVHATFFFVGEQAEQHSDLVQRAWFAYNQICTNTYDREVTKGSSPDWLEEEVRRGREAISNVMGGAEVSNVVRLPTDSVSASMIAGIDSQAGSLVAWDIDATGWTGVTSDDIYDRLMDVEPGYVVMMRDGGGDRSATVEALRTAIPALKKKGYSFVTISELLSYPAAE